MRNFSKYLISLAKNDPGREEDSIGNRSRVYFEVKNSPCIQQNRPLNIKKQSALNCSNTARVMVLPALPLSDTDW